MSVATVVKERPILFSGAMVQAILEGRKTQTRRVIKPQPSPDAPRQFSSVFSKGMFWWHPNETTYHSFDPTNLAAINSAIPARYCPYGQKGDRLWVRETWANLSDDSRPATYVYKADGGGIEQFKIWKPSIHMPRVASRITLEVTDVRVERVQDISEEDAIAEGIELHDPQPQNLIWFRTYGAESVNSFTHDPVFSFRTLWNSINKSRGFDWDSNPWTWAIEFKQVEVAA